MNHIGFVAGLAAGFWYAPVLVQPLTSWVASLTTDQGGIRCHLLG